MKIEKIYSRNRIKFHSFLNNKNDKKIDKKYSFLFNVVIIILTAIITFRALLGAINPILNRLCMDEAKNIATKISNEQASLIMNKYKCVACGYIYDEEKEGVKFEDLSDDWVCPLCGVGKDMFEKVEE